MTLRRVAALSRKIRALTDERSALAEERRTLMLDLNRSREASYADLVEASGTSPSWVAAELRRARDSTKTAVIPIADRRHSLR